LVSEDEEDGGGHEATEDGMKTFASALNVLFGVFHLLLPAPAAVAGCVAIEGTAVLVGTINGFEESAFAIPAATSLGCGFRACQDCETDDSR
jgi:hypothetical protein